MARWGLPVLAVGTPFAVHLAVAQRAGLAVAGPLVVLQLVAWVLALRRAARRTRLLLLLAPLGFLPALGLLLGHSEHGLVLAAALSHTAINGGLLAGFAATLRPGQTDLATGLAQRFNPHFRPDMAGYARGVTTAWCAFFALQLLVSGALLLWAPVAVWSLFVNVLGWPLLVAMALGELAVRRLRFPNRPHLGPMELVRAVRGAGGWTASPPGPTAQQSRQAPQQPQHQPRVHAGQQQVVPDVAEVGDGPLR